MYPNRICINRIKIDTWAIGKLYVINSVFSIYINWLYAYCLILISPFVKLFSKDRGVG
jgi:hypothetical protein